MCYRAMAYLGCHMYNENTDEIIKPATDVFEINDFTAATEWEDFIDNIENALRNWRVCGPGSGGVRQLERADCTNLTWKCRKEKFVFYGFQFELHHYKLDTGSEEDEAGGERVRLLVLAEQ